MLPVPKTGLGALDLSAGASLWLSVEGDRLVDPKKRRRYPLDELLAQCNPPVRRSREDRDWQAGAAVGRELV